MSCSGENTGSRSRQFRTDLDSKAPGGLLERGARAGESGELVLIESRLCRLGWHLFWALFWAKAAGNSDSLGLRSLRPPPTLPCSGRPYARLTSARALGKGRAPSTSLTERVCTARAIRILNLIPAGNVRTTCCFLQVIVLEVTDCFSIQGQLSCKFFHGYSSLVHTIYSIKECQAPGCTSGTIL